MPKTVDTRRHVTMCDYTYHRDKQIIIFHQKNEAITDSDSGCAIVVDCVSGVHWIDTNDGHYLCISESLCRECLHRDSLDMRTCAQISEVVTTNMAPC